VLAYRPSSADLYHPATFRDRGVAVGFTTPMLAGARVRDSGRQGKELLTHNPSGGRGTYVIPLAGVRERYRPTVHDVVLMNRLGELGRVSPSVVREAAWAVAREGYAGPAAKAAAHAVQESDRISALTAEFQLMSAVVDRVEPGGERYTSIAMHADLLRRGHSVLARLGRSFGRSSTDLSDALSMLAVAFAPVGVVHTEPQGRIIRLLYRLERTRDDIVGAQSSGRCGSGAELAAAIVASANIVIPCARAAIGAAQSLAADPLLLLTCWFTKRQQVAAAAARAEWFLDGWEQISLLWQSSFDNRARLGALLEMAQIIPSLPHEAIAWSPIALPTSALTPDIRVASRSDDWRSGSSAIRLIDRNERMRAMSL